MVVTLTEEEIKDLKTHGYSDEQITKALSEINIEDKPTSSKINSQYQSTFQYNPSDNLVKWQLDLNDILERAEHILREDTVTIVDGKTQWAINNDPNSRSFSNYGVLEILRVLSMYINRNTILGDYEPEEINAKVLDFGIELNNLIWLKYDEFGLDTPEKRKIYPMLIREMVDIVHSAYTRAKYGRELNSLRTARQISQTESIMPSNINIHTGEQMKERGIFNPIRYFGGKYK